MNDGGMPSSRPGAVVGHLGRLAVDERRRADDRRAERRRHRLHPEAHAEQRDAALGGDLDGVDRDAGVVRVARARRDDDPAEVRGGIVGQRLDLADLDRVVADDPDVRAGRLRAPGRG